MRENRLFTLSDGGRGNQKMAMYRDGRGAGITLGLALLLGTNVAMAECGNIQIADWNWASGSLIANLDKLILEAGYDCTVELVPGATMTTFTSMESKGQPDIASEMWANAVREPLAKALESGSLVTANTGPITGSGEGWWISPSAQAAHPEWKTVLDIIEHPELFPDRDDPSKGAFVGCPSGWVCQLINANLFRAFGMEEKGWKLVDPGSAIGLDDSITKAVDRSEYWFGYYWNPAPLIARHGMVMMDFGVPFGGSENWHGCIVKPEQNCADPTPSSWPESEVKTVVTAKFKKNSGPEVMNYLARRIIPGPVMDAMLADMETKQIKSSDTAADFLAVRGDVWKSWVSAAAAVKIKASVQ